MNSEQLKAIIASYWRYVSAATGLKTTVTRKGGNLVGIFVHRQPKGLLTKELEGVEELGEMLQNYGPLSDGDEVTVEITAPWHQIRELLGLKFDDRIWFHPGVGCGGCGTIGEGTPENLPPGWKIRRHRGGHMYLCPNCQKKPKAKSV